MKKIHALAEIVALEGNEALVRYENACAYVRCYDKDGFCFHANPFLSGWFETLEECINAAIDYLFKNGSPLVLLQKYISLLISSPWLFKISDDRLTIITPSSMVAVVDANLRVIHATDDDIQCSVYGFIESVKPYKL